MLFTTMDSGIFMCIGTTPRHALGRVGGIAHKANDVKGEMRTKEGVSLIFTAQRIVGYLLT